MIRKEDEMSTKIQRIRAICTAPEGINLVVVKVETNQPGLYGLGCATFAYRHLAVMTVIEEYLDPLLRGREVDRIEEMPGRDSCLPPRRWKRSGRAVREYQALSGNGHHTHPLPVRGLRRRKLRVGSGHSAGRGTAGSLSG